MIRILTFIYTVVTVTLPFLYNLSKKIAPFLLGVFSVKGFKAVIGASMFITFLGLLFSFVSFLFYSLMVAYNYIVQFTSVLNSSFGGSGGCVSVLLTDLGVIQVLNTNLPVAFTIITSIVSLYAAKYIYVAYSALLDYIKIL